MVAMADHGGPLSACGWLPKALKKENVGETLSADYRESP